MKISDVMSGPVLTLRPEMPARAAAEMLVSHGFSSAPVLDAEQRLVGIASEADLVRGRVVPEGWSVEETPEPTVGSVMTPAPVSRHPGDDLADAVALMLDLRIRALPVVDDGRLVGIVTRRDVLRLVARRELTSEAVLRRRLELSGHDRGTAS